MNLRTRVLALEATAAGDHLRGLSAHQREDISAAVGAWMLTHSDGDLLAIVAQHLGRPATAPITDDELVALAKVDAQIPHGTITAADVLRNLSSALRKVQEPAGGT